MRFFLLPLIFTPQAVLIWCVVRYFRNQKPNLLYQWMRGIGWIGLCALPVVAWQAAVALASGMKAMILLPGSWLVHLGGQSVIHIFEDNVKNWTGHRRDTMFDNADVFFALTAAQVFLLSSVTAWRFRMHKGWRDPLVLSVGIFVLVNAVLGMDWMWFGT
ncbi:MAG: hypothetical protein QM477_11045 [Planctomycetota bacterium]